MAKSGIHGKINICDNAMLLLYNDEDVFEESSNFAVNCKKGTRIFNMSRTGIFCWQMKRLYTSQKYFVWFEGFFVWKKIRRKLIEDHG